MRIGWLLLVGLGVLILAGNVPQFLGVGQGPSPFGAPTWNQAALVVLFLGGCLAAWPARRWPASSWAAAVAAVIPLAGAGIEVSQVFC
jgi:hypothetical protein